MCEECSKSIHNKGARKRHILDQNKLDKMGFKSKDKILEILA